MANHPNRSRRKPATLPIRPQHSESLVIQMAFIVNGDVCEVRKEVRRADLALAAEGADLRLGFQVAEVTREILKEARRCGWLIEQRNGSPG
jgi:hypothetical protein